MEIGYNSPVWNSSVASCSSQNKTWSLSPMSFKQHSLLLLTLFQPQLTSFLLDVVYIPPFLRISVHTSPFALVTYSWPTPSDFRLNVTALDEPSPIAPKPYPLLLMRLCLLLYTAPSVFPLGHIRNIIKYSGGQFVVWCFFPWMLKTIQGQDSDWLTVACHPAQCLLHKRYSSVWNTMCLPCTVKYFFLIPKTKQKKMTQSQAFRRLESSLG